MEIPSRKDIFLTLLHQSVGSNLIDSAIDGGILVSSLLPLSLLLLSLINGRYFGTSFSVFFPSNPLAPLAVAS